MTSGLAIYDTMNLVKCPIHTYCFGQAASMGAFLLAAGDKRYSLPNSRIMIHQPSTVVAGKASDIEISFNEIQTLKNVLNKILAKKTKKTLKEIEDATNDDNFMSAKEAKKFGLIDAILWNVLYDIYHMKEKQEEYKKFIKNDIATFAKDINILRNLIRYQNVHRNINESVAEHLFYVSCLVLKLREYYAFDLEKALKTALIHDIQERYISDVPHNIKTANPNLAKALEEAEDNITT